MNVTAIDTFMYWAEWKNWLFVRISTDEGLHGWGEASLAGPIQAVDAAIHELGAALIGQDPGGVERHWHSLYHAWRWRGGSVQSSALAGLDIALWDLEGKRLGVPVYRLLGGPFRPRVRCYASHWLSGVETPEQAKAGALEAVRRGFTAFKWSPFDPDRLREDEAGHIAHATGLMAAAREAVGPAVDIFVECGEALSPRTLLAAAQAFAPYRPGWFEEPAPFENAKVMVQLQRETPAPIATGERLLSRWEYRELLEGGGCRIIQPDLTHGGGITEVRKIAAMADTYFISVAPHNSAGPIGTLAAVHLAAAIPNFYILEQMEGERSMRDALCTAPLVYDHGFFEAPTTPGLGTDLHLAQLQAGRGQPVPLRRSSEPIWR